MAELSAVPSWGPRWTVMPAAVSSGMMAPAVRSEPVTSCPDFFAKSASGPMPVPDMPEK